MKTSYVTYLLTLGASLLMMACDDDKDFGGHDTMGSFTCIIDQGEAQSRTVYEYEKDTETYRGLWCKGDEIAMFFNGETTPRLFRLQSGAQTGKGTFAGIMPDERNDIMAVYPYGIVTSRHQEGVEVNLPEAISVTTEGNFQGCMPLVAYGHNDELHFYNLMSMVKLHVTGSGLLRRAVIKSADGNGLAGKASITISENGLPTLIMDSSSSSTLTIDFGAIILDSKGGDVMLPIPAGIYTAGLMIDFEFDGERVSYTIPGGLEFKASEVRPMRTLDFNVPFSFEDYTPATNEIVYQADARGQVTARSVFDTPVMTHYYSPILKTGIIVTHGDITGIIDAVFTNPKLVTALKLPGSIKSIGGQAFAQTSVSKIDFPAGVEQIADEAFNGTRLKEVVLPDGILYVSGFMDLSYLEKVYLPASIEGIDGYAFTGSTARLDHWDGDAKEIGADRRTLYQSLSYGSVTEKLNVLATVAGKDLTEYTVPENVEFCQSYAFKSCHSLRKITFPKGFRSLGAFPFSTSNLLEEITVYADVPPEVSTPEGMCGVDNLSRVRVPQSAVEAYKAAEGWRLFADKIVAVE